MKDDGITKNYYLVFSDDISLLSDVDLGQIIHDKNKSFKALMHKLLSKENFFELLTKLEQRFGKDGLNKLLNDAEKKMTRYRKNHKGMGTFFIEYASKSHKYSSRLNLVELAVPSP